MRRTKVICTIGPASDEPDIMRQLLQNGMNLARLNFSHGTHQEHGRRMELLHQLARESEYPLALILDTKGPEIRTGLLKNKELKLKEGQKIILTTENILGDENRIPITYEGLPRDVSEGDTILIDDGLLELRVEKTTEREIFCEVVTGGILLEQKGVNVPGIETSLPSLTDKDRADILFGLENGIDYIAASFVRTAQDIHEVRRVMEEKGACIPIIAKIESRAGVQNFDDILQAADAIMVARGDLGVEIPAEEVPLIQKKIIRACNQAGKPVITATQMLDSMIRNPRPTRAEATDIANAIFDGTDAIMLSGETANGKYPVEALKTMVRIAQKADEARPKIVSNVVEKPQLGIADSISHAGYVIASELKAAAIITPTTSGSTARQVSKYRPAMPIIAATPNPAVARFLCLVWGVEPVVVEEYLDTDKVISQAVEAALGEGFVSSGDMVVITAGVPVGVPGTTNLLKVHIIGEVIAQGVGIGKGTATGKVKIIRDENDLLKITGNDILVAENTGPEMVEAMMRASGVITEEGGLSSHAAIVGLNLNLPVIVGVKGATAVLEEGALVTMDATRGVIYKGLTRVL